jgi:hypothetical protein
MNQNMRRTVGAVLCAFALTAGPSGAQLEPPRSRPALGNQQPGPPPPDFGVRSLSNAAQSVPEAFNVTSNLRGLLRRPEVQSEIGLDLKQRNAIAAIEDEAVNSLREKIQLATQGQDAQFRNMSPDQRRVWIQRQQRELAMRMEASARPAQGDLDPKVRQILTPEQLGRLHELDLQKRGPLALGDPVVAQELKLSPQTRAAETRILNEYQSSIRLIVSEAMQAALQNGDVRQGNLPDFENRLSPLRKKLDANREQSDKRALEALTDEEKEAWTAAQGRQFRFRMDPVVRQPRQQGRRGAF